VVAVINFDARTEFGFRSVEWEATRVGDVIGAKSWWRPKGRFSASAFAFRAARHKRSRTRAIVRAGHCARQKFSTVKPAAVTPSIHIAHRRRGRTAPSRSLSVGAHEIRGGITVMRNHSFAAVAVLSLVGVLSSFHSSQAQAPAQPAPTAPSAKPLGQPCNLMSDLVQANPQSPKTAVPPRLTPIDATTKNSILNSGLPCEETTSGDGPDKTKTPLEHRQRGFDFYSWLTFIALNSPADGSGIDQSKPNTKTKWEDRANFKQLLDVMLEGGLPSNWEDKKQPPPGCKSQFSMPTPI
jgi:hypothetical protein